MKHYSTSEDVPVVSEEITLQKLAESRELKVDYCDDEIVIIDNVKMLVSNSMPAHLNMNILVICTEGKAQGTFDGQVVQLEHGNVFICPPNSFFTDFLFSHDFEFKAMFFTTHILQTFLREKISVWNEVMYINHEHFVKLDSHDDAYRGHFYDLLSYCLNAGKEMPYHTEIIRSLLQTAFLTLCGRLKQMLDSDRPTPVMRHGSTLFQRFLNLLEQQPAKHRTVESFATELCITPKYLSAVCKKQTGKTANEWIREQVLADTRYYLKQTDLSIKQICARMGFPNPSFFGKYVKQHFGMTPTQLRNS